MPERDESRSQATPIDHLWLLGILLLTGGLFFFAAGQWGLWEPWETEFARMGRAIATSDGGWLFPVSGSGDPMRKPWLTAMLLEWGYGLSRDPSPWLVAAFDALFLLVIPPLFGLLRPRLGRIGAAILAVGAALALVAITHSVEPETEFWLRAPLGFLGVITAAATFVVLRPVVGGTRAGVTALVMTTSPLFLMSTVNLAGAMPIISMTTLALLAFYWGAVRNNRYFWALSGLFAGLSVWAAGITGLLLVVGTIAFAGLWSLAQHPRDWLRPAPIVATIAVALLTLTYPLLTFARVGFEESKDIIGAFVPLGLAMTLFTAVLWSGALKRPGWRGGVDFVFPMVLIVLFPAVQYINQFGYDETLSFLLYNDVFSRRALDGHVSFDTLVRQLGFTAYPYTLFLPLALAYLAQTIRIEKGDTAAAASDDRGRSEVAFLKVFVGCWLVLDIALVGLTATLSRHFLFSALLPIALAVGLMLTDWGYWRGLRKNRTVVYLIGVGCLAVLMVLTKDLKTLANPELGQRGPEVLFEFLLQDGREAFPKSYDLPFVQGFAVVWGLILALYFWSLLTWLQGLPEKLADWRERSRTTTGERTGLRQRLTAPFAALGRGIVAVMVPVLRASRVVLRPLRSFIEPPKRFAAVLIVTTVLFAGVTAAAYLPNLADHLSNRGLIDTYRTLAVEGDVFYRVGSSRSQGEYYLGEDSIELDSGVVNPISSLRSVSELRRFFCHPEERMFAMISRSNLAQAYYEVRRGPTRGRGGTGDDDCDPERNLWVLDARSSRYVLVSNILAEGEENQNPISEHIFETLPDNVIEARPQYTFDSKLKLLGYRVLNEDGESVQEASTGDVVYLETFFEVLERAPSSREMFVHVDYRGQRIHGDHDPVGGDFPINYWVPGEIVRDRYALTISRGSATGDYSINFGFFTGDNRMQVRPATGDNRVTLGTIHVVGGI